MRQKSSVLRRPQPIVVLVGVLIVSGGCLQRAAAEPAQVITVAADGDDGADGSAAQPLLSLHEAQDRVLALMAENNGKVPAGGVRIEVRGGRYSYHKPLVFDSRFTGREDAPIVLAAAAGETPVFDGSIMLAADKLLPVTEDEWVTKLNSAARGEIVAMTVENSVAVELLEKQRANLSLDGRMMRYSRFPNQGFVHIDEIRDQGAVYAHGRTLGDPPGHSREQPIGGEFTLRETPTGDWAAELPGSQTAYVVGYLAYDWYRQRHRIAGFDEGRIKLQEYSRYGIKTYGEAPRRLRVFGLLSEVDQPGEWYFDPQTRRLFLYPHIDIDSDTTLGVWAGGTFADLHGCQFVTIEGLTISGAADPAAPAVVQIRAGRNNLLAGCTIRNSTRLAVRIDGGRRHVVRSCDIYDVSSHIRTEGGSVKQLEPTENAVENCHFTQVYADYYGGVALRGVGDRLSHCLIHNLPGQPITPSGNLQHIEYNEVFNVGFEEGDGGVMYNAQAVWGGYGQVFRGNFLHHVICVPGLHARGGIYFDQLYGGPVVEQNVFYKCAHRAVLVNGGANVSVRNNLFINGYIAYYNTDLYAASAHEQQPKYDAGELKRGDVGDYIWRTQQAVGENGWNQPPWKSRFPEFARLMNDRETCLYPQNNVVRNNLFCGNDERILWNHRNDAGAVVPLRDEAADQVPYLDLGACIDVRINQFSNPECLDFSFRSGERPQGIAPFDTAAAGLQRDRYRPQLPDKRIYRDAIRRHFRGIPSFDPDAEYDPEALARRRLNTGKMLIEPSAEAGQVRTGTPRP